MKTFLSFGSVVFSLVQLLILLALVYNYFILFISLKSHKLPEAKQKFTNKQFRFALILPAHNETAVIGNTVREMHDIAYPKELFDIFVVADHCQDNTASASRDAGAICYERNQGERGRKGFALAWLLERVVEIEPAYDAFVIFDADSRVNPGFLMAMNQGLVCGGLVLQGQHIISNVNQSLFNRLAAIDMRLNNRLKNAAKHNLGFSARLMGDAMCFTREILEQYPWGTFSLAEDMEYSIHLLQEGIRTLYIPEAVSYGQAAGGWKNAERQRVRWEGGVLDLRKRLGIKLFFNSIRYQSVVQLDRALELLLPPYSMLALISVFLLFAQWAFPDANFLVSSTSMIIVVMGWALFPFFGLLVDRAPVELLITLIYGPFYLLWRVWISILATIQGKGVQWVRTPRSEEM